MESNPISRKEETSAKKIFGLALRYLLPLLLTITLVWYLFSKVDFHKMLEIIRHGADLYWIICAMVISIFSHIFRAARWRLQLRGLGINPPFLALCCSIFGTYALNLIFPRLGEVWRCTYISKRQNASFTKVFGSMVADRLADTATVLCLVVLTFIVANTALTTFLEKYPVGRDLLSLITNPLFWAAIVISIMAVLSLLHIFRKSAFIIKLRQWCAELWNGFIIVVKMKGRGKFLLLTGCIWGCYFFQLYVAFFAFPFTKALVYEPGTAFGLTPCLVAFVLSSIGMAIPSNGGLGPWNIAVMFGLALFGINDTQGTAFSMLQWSGQTVMLVLLGIFTMVYLSIGRKHYYNSSSSDSTITPDNNQV
ncbi:MAG: flippase-like domain-containing protein [Prevotella sp.]|nr:flippase-like domain-containing protein [Bacteroides sp.]MCM1366013.1 flippase-like domain-containing protein [Prevotella sp.]MCM1436917.1 flippase-like domain-containing protein [Prevotella sp.]